MEEFIALPPANGRQKLPAMEVFAELVGGNPRRAKSFQKAIGFWPLLELDPGGKEKKIRVNLFNKTFELWVSIPSKPEHEKIVIRPV